MTENIPALIAEARTRANRYIMAGGKWNYEEGDLFRRLADALESLSAPPATDDEREALAKFIRDSAGYNLAVILSEGEADFLAGEFLRFRRPSPLTREALADLIENTIPHDLPGWRVRYSEQVADAIWSKFALPEPGAHIVPCARCGQKRVIASDAENSKMEVCGDCGIAVGQAVESAEVEWGLSDSMLNSFPEPHFTTRSEESARMNQRRGHPAIKVVSRTVTPWVQVKATEQK